MTTYESSQKALTVSAETAFNILSDLNNLQKLQDLPVEGKEQVTDKLKDMEFSQDSIRFSVEGFGKLGLRVVEREPFKTIKFEGENTPVGANMWIQLKEVAENDTRMKLTIKADIPFMIKMMVDKKLKEGIEMIAEAIAKAVSAYPNSPEREVF